MKRNFAYTAVSVGSRLLVGLLLFLLLARLWGPAKFGLFSFVFSFSGLLVLLVDFGFAVYLLREVAARPAEAPQLIAGGFRAKLVLTLVVLLLLTIAMLIAGQQVLPPALVVPVFLAALTMSFADFFVAPLRALGRFDLEAMLVASANAVQFAFAGTVAWHGGSVVAVAWAMVGSRALYLLLAWQADHKVVAHLRLFGPLVTGPLRTLRAAWPYGADSMLVTGWNLLDVVVVRALFGNQAVGLYSAGQKLVLGISALAPVVGNVMIPRLSSLFREGSCTFRIVAVKTGALLAGVGLVFALPLIFFADVVATHALGSRYQEIGNFLPYFGLLLFARFLGAAAGVIATAAGLQVRRVVAQLVGMGAAGTALGLSSQTGISLVGFIMIMLFATVITACMNYWNLLRSGVLKVGVGK